MIFLDATAAAYAVYINYNAVLRLLVGLLA